MPQARARWPSWLKRLGILSLLAGALAAHRVYQSLVDPQRVHALARNYLERITHRRVTLASASFSLTEGIRLGDLTIWERPPGGPAAPDASTERIFSCHEVKAMHSPWALIQGRLEIESLSATSPTCTLVHDGSTGWSKVAALMRDIVSNRPGSLSPPPIELRDARLRIVHRTASGDQLAEDVRLTVRGRRDADNSRLFNLVWQDALDPSAHGHSQIDLLSGNLRNVRGGLPTMSLRGVMLAIDAGFEGADALSDLLGLQGRVWARDYDLIGSTHQDGARSATVDLRDASLSIPISDEERGLPPDQRYLRFSAVNGSVAISPGRIQADFTGIFHGSPCTVSARIDGILKPGISLDDVSLRAEWSIPELDLPDQDQSEAEERLIRRWPQVARFYHTFDPHGQIGLRLRVEKPAGPGARFLVRDARVSVRGANAWFKGFPYRGEELTGEVDFGPGGVFVRQLCGRHGPGRVCVDGWLEAPNRTSRAEFTVLGEGIAIDDDLLRAIKPHQRQRIEDLNLAGLFDARVTLRRPAAAPGSGERTWETVVEAQFTGLSSRTRRFPYPLENITGHAIIQPDHVEIVDLTGRAGTGQFQLRGALDFGAASLQGCDLHVEASGLTSDDAMLAALPEEFAAMRRTVTPEGCFSFTSDLALDAKSQEWSHQTRLMAEGMRLQFAAFPVPLDDVWADVELTGDGLVVQQGTGRLANAQVAAAGRSRWGPAGSASWAVNARGLSIDQALLKAAPDQMRRALSGWEIRDPVDADLQLAGGKGGELSWNAEVRLPGVEVAHEKVPLPFRDVHASVLIVPGAAHARGMSARFGEAALRADFDLLGDSSAANARIRLQAEAVSLDDSIRRLLPPQAWDVWEQLSPSGQANVYLDEVIYRKKLDSDATCSVRGTIQPHDVHLAGLAGGTTLSAGLINLGGYLVDSQGGTALTGSLGGGGIALYGQKIGDLSGTWAFARTVQGQGTATFQGASGRLHGGTVSGDAEIQFGAGPANYRLSASIHGMQLAPYLESSRLRRTMSSGGKPLPEVRGTVNADWYLGGECNRLDSRLGGGQVEIRKGYIYRLPIFLAILNVLDITVPNSDVLGEARAGFYVTGNKVSLSEILVEGEALSLAGSGALSLRDYSVDLTLMNMGAGRLEKVPVLAELWEGASREVIELRVTGPVGQPRVWAQPFGGVSDELKKIFQKRRPRTVVQAASP